MFLFMMFFAVGSQRVSVKVKSDHLYKALSKVPDLELMFSKL